MKRLRKLTIEIEHREVTVLLRLPLSTTYPAPDAGPETANGRTDGCRSCDGVAMVPLAEALASYRGGQEALARAIAAGALHVSRTGSTVWLCEESFNEFLKTLPPEFHPDSKETAL